MKYFSSSSAVVTTLRKAGYYPSTRVAHFLAKRFAFLFEEESIPSSVSIIAQYLRGDQIGWEKCIKHFTPAEFQVLYEFGAWWAYENGENHSDGLNHIQDGDDVNSGVLNHVSDRAFIGINLNRGRMLTILSR